MLWMRGRENAQAATQHVDKAALPAIALASEHPQRLGHLGPRDRIGDELHAVRRPVLDATTPQPGLFGLSVRTPHARRRDDQPARRPHSRRDRRAITGSGYLSRRRRRLGVVPGDVPNAGEGSLVAEGAVGAPLVVVAHPVWQRRPTCIA